MNTDGGGVLSVSIRENTSARVSIRPASRAAGYESWLNSTTSGSSSTAFSTLKLPDCELPKTGI